MWIVCTKPWSVQLRVSAEIGNVWVFIFVILLYICKKRQGHVDEMACWFLVIWVSMAVRILFIWFCFCCLFWSCLHSCLVTNFISLSRFTCSSLHPVSYWSPFVPGRHLCQYCLVFSFLFLSFTFSYSLHIFICQFGLVLYLCVFNDPWICHFRKELHHLISQSYLQLTMQFPFK